MNDDQIIEDAINALHSYIDRCNEEIKAEPSPVDFDTLYGTYGRTIAAERDNGEEEYVVKGEAEIPDPRYVPVYTKEDVDKVVMMLTLWIPDMDIRTKLEEIYQCWKDTQK